MPLVPHDGPNIDGHEMDLRCVDWLRRAGSFRQNRERPETARIGVGWIVSADLHSIPFTIDIDGESQKHTLPIPRNLPACRYRYVPRAVSQFASYRSPPLKHSLHANPSMSMMPA